MATEISNLAALEKELRRRTNKALQGKCTKQVKKCVADHAQKEVYKTYQPREYDRRYSLTDESEIVAENGDCTLEVRNVAEIDTPVVPGYSPKSEGLTALVEQGAYPLFGKKGRSTFLEGRRYMLHAKKEVHQKGTKVHEAILQSIKNEFPDN